MTKKRIAILGSTGSIGRQTLEVCAKEPDRLEVVALAAHSSVDTIVAQAREFFVSSIALADGTAAGQAARELLDTRVFAGPQGILDMLEQAQPDVVVNALVGSAGLRATVATLQAGKILALANKESLVAGGDIVMPLARPGQLLPVDSEHSAIFQCLMGEDAKELSRIWLTASGGPFRGKSRADLQAITPEQALAHPTWEMGAKISIDSSTMMNKGLEVIEAHHLFAVPYEAIDVVVHPQSIIHSMVEYVDGSVLAHLGPTDMRIPIQYALSYPSRWSAPLAPLDMTMLSDLSFEPCDRDAFSCLRLAYEAGRSGGTAPVVLNAANEVAVQRFLTGQIGYLDIADTVERTLHQIAVEPVGSLEHIEQVDAQAREVAQDAIA